MVTVMIRDRTTGARVFTHKPGRHDPSVVRRIVQHLDFQELPRIVNASDGFEQALHNIALVENGQLDGDRRQLFELLQRTGRVLLVLQVSVGQQITVDAVNRKDNKNRKVRDQNREIKGIRLVDSAKWVLAKDADEIAQNGIIRVNKHGQL